MGVSREKRAGWCKKEKKGQGWGVNSTKGGRDKGIRRKACRMGETGHKVVGYGNMTKGEGMGITGQRGQGLGYVDKRGQAWGGNKTKGGKDGVKTGQKREGMEKQEKSGQVLGETEQKAYQDKRGQDLENRSKRGRDG